MSTIISSVESQKGAIADQRCSIENKKGAIVNDFVVCTAIAPFWFSTDDIMFVKPAIASEANLRRPSLLGN